MNCGRRCVWLWAQVCGQAPGLGVGWQLASSSEPSHPQWGTSVLAEISALLTHFSIFLICPQCKHQSGKVLGCWGLREAIWSEGGSSAHQVSRPLLMV